MTSPEWSTATQNDAEGHETEASGWEPSTSVRDQVPLLHSSTPPEPSTATQKEVEGQETPVGATPMVVVGAGPGSIRAGADQAVPFQSRASPPPLTAMQNDVVTHEIPVKGALLPSGSGIVQLSPFHCERPPDADMQNTEDTHVMADTDPQSPLVRVQDEPLREKALPSASTAAQ